MRADWVECKLGEIFEIVSGNTPKGLENISNEGNIQFYKVSDMNSLGNEVNMTTSNYNLSESDIDKLKIKLFPKGTIIFPKRGGAILTNKKRKLKYDSSFDLNIMGIIPNKFVASSYLFNFFISIDLGKIADGSNVPQINNKNIEPLLFPLPPISEQRAIVKKIEALFSSLDAGIADLKKAQDQLKTYRQAVLKKAFEGELTKEWRDNDVVNKIPLKEILTLTSSKHKAEKPVDLFYIGLEHIEKDLGILTPNAGIDLISTVKNKFEENNILYGKLRPYLNKVYLSKENGVCSTDILVFKVSEKVLGKYIHQFMLSREFVNDMSNNTSGVNLPRVSTKYIENYLIPLPSLEEQAQIVKEIESRLSVCDAVEQQIKDGLSQSEALRQSILKKAFEGRLLTEAEIKACQQEADYEPVAVLLEKIKAEKEANKLVKKTKKK